MSIPAIILWEFGEGFERSDDPELMRLRNDFEVVPVDAHVASRYGEVSRALRAVGGNDTWIAATALATECPLLSRNMGHFARVPGLEVISYDG